MLRKTRLCLAIIFWVLITWLLVDFTSTAHAYLGWMAKIQFIPALLSVNVGVLIFLVALTLLFGRIYCSFICPLGVMQDVIAWFRRKKNKYSYSPAHELMRPIFVLLAGVALAAGFGWLAGLIFPYSAYGRIVGTLVAPLYKLANNVLAGIAEHYESYAFYEVDVWLKSVGALVIALATWCIIAVLAWRGGRTWCNTVCPVGTVLGMLSRHARLKVVIDANECRNCRKCERNCKAACIDLENHEIDYSRCVVCGDCLEECKFGALAFGYKPMIDKENIIYAQRKKEQAAPPKKETAEPIDEGRRAVLTSTALLAGAALAQAQDKTTDGGYAIIEDKKKPERAHRIVPPGALSAANLREHCTACQLCIDSCPNDVLRPSNKLNNFMQPEVSFERGYCRPECNRCSQVCPTGAIKPVTIEERTAIQVGHAVWVRENCIPANEFKTCGNCARHCPTGAIQMVPEGEGLHRNERGRWVDRDNRPIDMNAVHVIPVVNEEKCIGCGACENLCPVRPYSAIYVEGHDKHREI
ncbi:MAG: 4Fe-4S binding protein [Bacteroidaceae bacterium]|nr:4Fe-4S binding protein [Bacteroidaceae bacterium]